MLRQLDKIKTTHVKDLLRLPSLIQIKLVQCNCVLLLKLTPC